MRLEEYEKRYGPVVEINPNLQALVSYVSAKENDVFLQDWWKWQEAVQKLPSNRQRYPASVIR